MKIGIFTFHCAANYGAVLQAYCLQEVLKNMGHEVYVIDYRPKYLIEPYKAFFYEFNHFNSLYSKIKGFIRACLVAPIRWKRNKEFSKFINRRLNLYKLDLNDEINDFDAFVFGSDQIWNPKITNGFDKVYLGDFPAAKGKKLIAYAASVGSILNLADGGLDIDYFSYRLKCFDKVFVREKSLSEYINKYFKLQSEVAYDPVILAGIDVLNNLLTSFSEKSCNKYLLLFQLFRNDDIAKYAKEISCRKCLDMVEFATTAESLFNRKMKQSVSVEKLLLYFKKSSYIITTSFHGTVLSILFNKQFNTVSISKNIDERAVQLLEDIGLSNRLITIDSVVPDDVMIDYLNVQRLFESRNQCIIKQLKKIF